MPLVSVTRLRLRGWTALVPFVRSAAASAAAARDTPGFVDGRMNPLDRGLVFWTLTRWQDAAALATFRGCAAHRTAMGATNQLASEIATATWESADADLPTWLEAHERLAREGRRSPLVHASRAHVEGGIPEPWTWLSTPGPFRRRE